MVVVASGPGPQRGREKRGRVQQSLQPSECQLRWWRSREVLGARCSAAPTQAGGEVGEPSLSLWARPVSLYRLHCKRRRDGRALLARGPGLALLVAAGGPKIKR